MSRSNNGVQYYLRTSPKEKSGKYISKSEEKLIKLHLSKRYNKQIINLVEQEIYELRRLIKKSSNIFNQIKDIYSESPQEIKSYLTPIDISDEDYINEWMSIPFQEKHKQNLLTTYKTNQGELVRSKSELNIANALYKKGIPYKYECPLTLNNIVIYPDFTVLDVKNRREVYWEHRGMMDDRDYIKHSVLRLKDYSKSGIVLGKNLIISEESAAYTLGTDEIDRIIKQYFLR